MFFELKSVSKRYNRQSILNNISFQVEKGDIVSIIGPSGVGKTTLLKLIAGLEPATTGSIQYEVKPTIEHPVILVFQDFILFPNLNVYENVAFGLRARKVDVEEIEERVVSILSYFNLESMRKSYPNTLSAGQRQRVAIARAMVVNPSTLLLDEPFAHLDQNLRLETAEFIRTTQKRFGVTTVSVTHDLQEAFAMSDKIGIMLDGRLVQYDTAEKIYFEPNTFEVAKFLGPVNIIPESLFQTLGIESECMGHQGPVFARAEGITIEKDEEGPGVVVDVCFVGLLILYRIEIEGAQFLVYSLSNGILEGDRVRLKVERCSTSGS
jgi:putative spermidine/putrescine transport system ATP-binding protein